MKINMPIAIPGKLIIRLLVLLLLAFSASELANQLPAIDAFNESWIDAHTRNNGITGALQYILVAAILASVGMPRQLIAFLGGYAFGFLEGVIYSTLAVTLSCLLTMMLSRLYARPLMTRLFARKINKIDRFLSINPMTMAIVIRLLPIGNNLLTNLLAGVTKVPAKLFITGSCIGYVPQMAVFALMGKGIVVHSFWKISLSIVLLAISSMLGIYLYKKYKADTLLNEELEQQEQTLTKTIN